MKGRSGVVRGTLVGAVGVAALLALVAGTAFACTPQASLKLSSTSGGIGTKLTATGSTFDASGQAVKVWWDGPSKGILLGTAAVKADRTFSVAVEVPSTSGGTHIVSATQSDAAGQPIAGSPVNAVFRVDGVAAVAAPSNAQADSDSSVSEPVVAPVPVADTAAAPAPVAAPAPRVRVAPRTTVRPAAPVAAAPAPAPAPAAVAAPAPVAEPAPAPVAAPAPAVTPAPAAAPATTPARRSVMVSMSGHDGGSPALAIALVGIGLALALGASAVVLAGRRDRKAPAGARR